MKVSRHLCPDQYQRSMKNEVVLEWEQANRQHYHGVHKYNLEDYGLSREEINEKCATYIERYQQYF